mgnify:CR=1 FL=1
MRSVATLRQTWSSKGVSFGPQPLEQRCSGLPVSRQESGRILMTVNAQKACSVSENGGGYIFATPLSDYEMIS